MGLDKVPRDCRGMTAIASPELIKSRPGIVEPVDASANLKDVTAHSQTINARLENDPSISIGSKGRLESFREYEIRFVMSYSALNESLSLDGLPASRINQSYFHREDLPRLKLQAAELLGIKPLDIEGIDLTSARVRKTELLTPGCDLKATRYTLDLKGPKGVNGVPGRAEYSVPIDEPRYLRLLKLADNGLLSKIRYTVEGDVYRRGSAGEEPQPCTAEIDLLLHAGREQSAKEYRESQPLGHRYDFVTVDLEVASAMLLPALASGRHSFDFLKGNAINLAFQSEEVQRAFSTRRMAKEGMDRKLIKALRSIDYSQLL